MELKAANESNKADATEVQAQPTSLAVSDGMNVAMISRIDTIYQEMLDVLEKTENAPRRSSCCWMCPQDCCDNEPTRDQKEKRTLARLITLETENLVRSMDLVNRGYYLPSDPNYMLRGDMYAYTIYIMMYATLIYQNMYHDTHSKDAISIYETAVKFSIGSELAKMIEELKKLAATMRGTWRKRFIPARAGNHAIHVLVCEYRKQTATSEGFKLIALQDWSYYKEQKFDKIDYRMSTGHGYNAEQSPLTDGITSTNYTCPIMGRNYVQYVSLKTWNFLANHTHTQKIQKLHTRPLTKKFKC
ncbi:hypothetical protein Ciccas_009531 [Cichlidogyrus casuarinus]|uniref:Uncharacterized protein n=1 Tax=Cichlidogyrus casuarinus TaxID=1844966 RepID=A0ABD2PXR3_9PLAT